MGYKKIKVLIVDDSLFFRTTLKNLLSSDNYIEVVDCAANAAEAERKIKELSPDVVTLDVEMPGTNGIDFLKNNASVSQVPVVLVSSVNINVFDALDAGAIDFVKKPLITSNADLSTFGNELSVKIKIASSARVAKKLAVNVLKPNLSPIKVTDNTIIAIGASTGGTEAILSVVKSLPIDSPPILVTQHMPEGFTKMYADRLNKICNMKVIEASNGDRLEKGLILIAPGNKQMELKKDSRGYFVKCEDTNKVNGHCPSVDVLFNSVAKFPCDNVVGIILTGMGRDGAEGLLNMRKSGAYTIGQDKDSCVVYGMPSVAYNIGAVINQAPLDQISDIIIKKLNSFR